MSTFWPGCSVCSVKQKHWIFLKYLPTMSGETLYTACAGDRPRAEVLRPVENLRLRAGRDVDRQLLRLEPPRQARMGVGVELNLELARDRARRRGRRAAVVPLSPVASQKAR